MVMRSQTNHRPSALGLRILVLVMLVTAGAIGAHYLLSAHNVRAAQGDLNGDGRVDQADLDILESHYGQSGAGAAEGDLNGDGVIDVLDLSIMTTDWGGGGTVTTNIPLGLATGAGIPSNGEMDAYKAAGASFIRFGLAWDTGSSRVDGNFDNPDSVARAIAYANSIHLGVILITGAGPTYDGHMFSHNVAFAQFVANVAAYFNGTTESSGRYVWAIEVGNEPNLNAWDHDTTTDQKGPDYADLMIRVYDPLFENVKARTTRPIIIAGIARTSSPLRFTQEAHAPITVDGHSFPDGIRGHYDGWTLHPYDYDNLAGQDLARGNGGFYDMTQVMNWFQTTYGSMPPLYITEYGQPTYPENATTLQHQADSVNDAVYQLTRLNYDVRAFAWFTFMDKSETSTKTSDRFGIVDTTSSLPIPTIDQKPAYAAFHSIGTTQTVPVTP